jgi:hypothetical protein
MGELLNVVLVLIQLILGKQSLSFKFVEIYKHHLQLFEHDGAFLDQWRVSDDEFQE